MGFSFKKSKNFGGFKVNLSKSGIGFSTGVKGFRVSAGPNGVNLNAGRNGRYYRKKLSTSDENVEDDENVETYTTSEDNSLKEQTIYDKKYTLDWISNFEDFVQSQISYSYKVTGSPYRTPKEFDRPSLTGWYIFAFICLFVQFLIGLSVIAILFYYSIKLKKSDKAIAEKRYNEALAFYRDKKYDAAIDCYKEILEKFPILQIKQAITACFIKKKDYQSALEQSNSYCYSDADKIRVVELLFCTEKYTELINYIQNFSDKLKENVEVITLLGLSYLKLENFEKALEVLSLGPTKKRTKIDYFLAQYFYALGSTYEKLQQNDKAITQFKKVAIYNEDFSDIKRKLPIETKEKTLSQNFDDFNSIKTFDSYFISCDKYRKKDGNIERGDCQILLNAENFLIKQDTEIIKNKISSIYYFDIWEYEEKTYFKIRMRSLTEYIFGAIEFEADEIANYLKTFDIKIEDNR